MKLDPGGLFSDGGLVGKYCKYFMYFFAAISLRQRYDTHSNQFTLPSPKLSPSTVQRNSIYKTCCKY